MPGAFGLLLQFSRVEVTCSDSVKSRLRLGCQGSSRAGKRLGLEDERTALLSHCFRVADETHARPD